MQDKFSLLQTYFGYDTFRTGQEEIIDALTTGRDAVGIMPTGAGKSLCFQIPALLLDGVSLIISPLISLMKDQVNALTQAGIPAAFLNSSLTAAQQRRVLDNARQSKYTILYVAPERLSAPEFLEFSRQAEIPFVGVDEAHCVSQWGQDFRPSYLRISEFIQGMDVRPVVGAFTATATKRVREDMVRLLCLRDPMVVSTGFDRQNLYFEVDNPRDKFGALRLFLEQREGKSGIVYCLTRKTVEEVCQRLRDLGLPATRYHAGLPDQERKGNQERFQADEAPVMVATNAFGMGIDKSNVSYVVHYNMPKNMEGYYQEAGRAGRDGAPAECLLLYSGQDVITNQFLIDKARDNEEMDGEAMEAFRLEERARLRVMTFYCHTQDCLRAYILRYFGDRAPVRCGNCSNCTGNTGKEDVTVEAQKILSCVKRMGERFGMGMVIDTLRGSRNEKVLRFGFDKLSTYGIMADTKATRLREIINQLVLGGYLTLTNTEFPVLQLGPGAKGLLFGGETVTVNAAKVKKEATERPPRQTRGQLRDPRLFSKLQALRGKLASIQSVPAFVIFADASLLDMCNKRPTTREELLEVSGVGQAKLERYGDKFLAVIRAHLEETGTVEEGGIAEPVEVEALTYREALAAQGVVQAFKRWTDQEDVELRGEFDLGKSLEEIAQAHGRTRRAIEMRLEKLGLELPDNPGTSADNDA